MKHTISCYLFDVISAISTETFVPHRATTPPSARSPTPSPFPRRGVRRCRTGEPPSARGQSAARGHLHGEPHALAEAAPLRRHGEMRGPGERKSRAGLARGAYATSGFAVVYVVFKGDFPRYHMKRLCLNVNGHHA